jgi:TPR repeat protein
MRFAISVIALMLMPCSCIGQSASEIAKTAFRSVVLLEMNDSGGQPLSLGSGFFVSDGIIATNTHVIDGAYSGTAKLVGDTQKLQILGTIAIDRHADLALIKVNSSAPPLRFGPAGNPGVGDKVYVIGNPLGLEGTFSEGIISGIRSVDSESVLQMTAPISHGSSGGPVMDSTGGVIGVAEATFSDGQNLNLAVPVSYLSKLLSSATRQVEISPLGGTFGPNQSNGSIVEAIVGGGAPKESPGEMEKRAQELYAETLHTEAAVLFDQACAGGYTPACRSLGVMYQDGDGIPQDYSKAMILYSKSCNAGDSSACDNLGGMYQEGLGVEKDYFRAVALYSRACDGGNSSSCNNLGTMYLGGDGVVQDKPRAVALYSKSCDGGSATGCKNLAGCYRDGEGIKKDKEKAKQIFIRSCKLGSQLGCDALKKEK